MRRIILASAFVFAFVAARHRAVLHPAPPVVTDGPTFSNEVVRVFQNRCQSCHHPGDIAPFSLMTYADAAPHADAIKYMTQTHQMPPWKATQSCGDFVDALLFESGAPFCRSVDVGNARVSRFIMIE